VTTRFWRLLGHTRLVTPPARGRLSATFRHDDDVMVDTINVCPANGMLLRTLARDSGPDGPAADLRGHRQLDLMMMLKLSHHGLSPASIF
jgi:hypothetical protein